MSRGSVCQESHRCSFCESVRLVLGPFSGATFALRGVRWGLCKQPASGTHAAEQPAGLGQPGHRGHGGMCRPLLSGQDSLIHSHPPTPPPSKTKKPLSDKSMSPTGMTREPYLWADPQIHKGSQLSTYWPTFLSAHI